VNNTVPKPELDAAAAYIEANKPGFLEDLRWYLLLAAVIGLRLVKTTADVADSVRRP